MQVADVDYKKFRQCGSCAYSKCLFNRNTSGVESDLPSYYCYKHLIVVHANSKCNDYESFEGGYNV